MRARFSPTARLCGRRGPDTVRRGLEDFVRQTGADELMVTANIFDHEKRKRSFEIIAQVHGGMGDMALLSDFAVVQLGGGLAAAVCGRLFADVGARVSCIDPDASSHLACPLNDQKPRLPGDRPRRRGRRGGPI